MTGEIMYEERTTPIADLYLLTDKQIENEVHRLNLSIIRLKHKIEVAKEKDKRGIPMDLDWFNRADYAVRNMAIRLKRVEMESGRRNRKRKQEAKNELGEVFIETARRRLESHWFKLIMAETNDQLRKLGKL